MDIHVLTQNPEAEGQLTELLRTMGHSCVIHQDVEPLLRAVKKLKKQDIVLYDLSLENQLWAFERLYLSCRRTNLVGFELLTKETAQGGQYCIDGMGHYLLLPQNRERAQARIQEMFKSVARAASPQKRTPSPRPKTQAKTSGGVQPDAQSGPVRQAGEATAEASIGFARYLHVRSEPMQSFLLRLRAAVGEGAITLIDGEDGAEFELIAREFNFQANGDAYPLVVIDPLHLNFDELRQMEKSAAALKQLQNCFIDMSIELNNASTIAMVECMEHLRSLAHPYLHLVVGHVSGSESYFCDKTEGMLQALRQQATTLSMPPFAERAADIPLIVQNIFSTLRVAHPFLKARTLSQSAIQFLQDECQNFDYARVVRVLRNAMALGESETLTEKELQHLDDNSPITQHLIESLADEKFFDFSKSGVA